MKCPRPRPVNNFPFRLPFTCPLSLQLQRLVVVVVVVVVVVIAVVAALQRNGLFRGSLTSENSMQGRAALASPKPTEAVLTQL